jgi:hypothetical protein
LPHSPISSGSVSIISWRLRMDRYAVALMSNEPTASRASSRHGVSSQARPVLSGGLAGGSGLQ